MQPSKSFSLPKNLNYVKHCLNFSKSKATFSFEKSRRFQEPKSHSPNKFYDQPSETHRIGFSMGKSNRFSQGKQSSLSPVKYKIASQFEKKHQRSTSDTFGISRQDYYKAQSSKNLVGPGAYNIPRDLGGQHFYIGQKLKPIQNHDYPRTQLNITGEVLCKLSTFTKNNSAVRLKTEYYPKSKLQMYDNKVPGPGSYEQSDLPSTSRHKTTLTTFGATQRLKADKPSLLGPGRYQLFSEFGKPE